MTFDQGENSSPALPLLGFPGPLPNADDFDDFRVGELQRLLGFWLLWHMYDGLDGIVRSGLMSQASVYRHLADFRNRFDGVEVWELRPSVTSLAVDPDSFFGSPS